MNPHKLDFYLYLVTDRHRTRSRPLTDAVGEALAAGVRCVQLREKDLPPREFLRLADRLRRLTSDHHARLIINDRVAVCLAVEADGVHLPSNSLPIETVRAMIGPDRLIGVSTHRIEEIQRAEPAGADFVVLGPIFPTASKPDGTPTLGAAAIGEAKRTARLPVFGIGGVHLENLIELRRVGADGAAVISEILGAKNIAETVRKLMQRWTMNDPLSVGGTTIDPSMVR
jgi:thiamine-phosphate pyrophosphorylase